MTTLSTLDAMTIANVEVLLRDAPPSAFKLPPSNVAALIASLVRIRTQPSFAVPAYTTSDGRDVRIFARDGGFDYPVMGAYRDADGWRQARWSESLRCASGKAALDLVARGAARRGGTRRQLIGEQCR